MDCYNCSNNYKIFEARKWQFSRIFKLLVFFVWIFSFFSLCFGAEDEVVDGTVVQNLGFDWSSTEFITKSYPMIYYPIEDGYIYTLTSLSGSKVYGFCNSEPALGVSVYNATTFGVNSVELQSKPRF